MSDTTKIDVHLVNPNGTPMTNTRFTIKPVRAGFWSTIVGLVEDAEIIYQTDSTGYVQMELWPLPYPYIMTYSYEESALPGQFLFYVPQVTHVVDFQDLVVTKADSSDKYADTILEQIIAAKVEVTQKAAEAAASAASAANSATGASVSAGTAAADAVQTNEDRAAVLITQQNVDALFMSLQEAVVKIQAINLQNKLKLGEYTLWVDADGKLRIVMGEPSGDKVGVVVGTQTA